MVRAIALPLLALSFAAVSQESPTQYRSRIATYQKQADEELTNTYGWLSVVGLCWLQDGQTVAMTLDAKGHPKMPAPEGPSNLCSFTRLGDNVWLNVAEGAHMAMNGKPLPPGTVSIRGEAATAGPVLMSVIRRGDRVGIRIRDSKSEAKAAFTGRKWFPIDPKYRVRAKFVAYKTPRTMPIANVLGDTQPVPNPGYVEFTLNGKTCRLNAEGGGGGLFFNFTDLTSGKSTYPAGRFLSADKPVNGFTTLDFNTATNPPCAFTAYATCPLPPTGNDLRVEVKAGEKTHHPKE